MSNGEYEALEKLVTSSINGVHSSLTDFKKSTITELSCIKEHLKTLNGTVATNNTEIEVLKVTSKTPKGLWIALTSLVTVVGVLSTYIIMR